MSVVECDGVSVIWNNLNLERLFFINGKEKAWNIFYWLSGVPNKFQWPKNVWYVWFCFKCFDQNKQHNHYIMPCKCWCQSTFHDVFAFQKSLISSIQSTNF